MVFKKNPLIPVKPKTDSNFKTPENQSAGILDDYSVRKVTSNQVTYTSQIRIGKGEADRYIYFYDGGSETGKYIAWQDSPPRFIINELLQVSTGVKSLGYVSADTGMYNYADNSSADTAYVPMFLYGTDSTPPTASNFPIGTYYIQYTA